MEETPMFDLNTVFDVDDYLYVYGDDLTDDRSEAEVASLVRLLELDSPLHILDLACGFGRHANRLAALGHTVTGIDWMSGFLDIARERAQVMGVQVNYQQGDMRHLKFEAEFDRVLLMFTSFGYFTDDENAQVIHNIARALKPGGLLGLDIPNRDTTAGEPPMDAVIDKPDGMIINRLSFDVCTGRFHNRRVVIRDGVRKDKPFSIRLYNVQEIRALIEDAGLDVVKLVGGDEQPLSSQSRRLIVIARKPIKGVQNGD
jgi:SAM-dependent methyltransferase